VTDPPNGTPLALFIEDGPAGYRLTRFTLGPFRRLPDGCRVWSLESDLLRQARLPVPDAVNPGPVELDPIRQLSLPAHPESVIRATPEPKQEIWRDAATMPTQWDGRQAVVAIRQALGQNSKLVYQAIRFTVDPDRPDWLPDNTCRWTYERNLVEMAGLPAEPIPASLSPEDRAKIAAAVAQSQKGPGPAPEPKEHGLTEAERKTLRMSALLWNNFLELPEIHPDDRTQVRGLIHQIQQVVMGRVATRTNPDTCQPDRIGGPCRLPVPQDAQVVRLTEGLTGPQRATQ
jgi:hypothetical protein